MDPKKRLREIEERKLEIRTELENPESEPDFDAVDEELRKLEAEKQKLERRIAITAGIQSGEAPAQRIGVLSMDNEQRSSEDASEMLLASPEYRSGFLKSLQGRPLSDTEQRALTSADNSAGAAIPTSTLNKVIDRLRQTSVLYPHITSLAIPGRVRLVVANAKNAAQWKAEGADGTVADDTVTNVDLFGYELIKLAEMSATVQAMSIDAFEDYISAEIGRQMAIAIENAILNGTGTGQPLGILSGLTWDASNSVEYTTLNYDTFMDALALLPTLYHQQAFFVMNRKTLFGGVRKIKATDGQPIFAYNPQDRAAMTILGYPILLDDYAPDDAILLGDLGYYYWNFNMMPTISVSTEAGFKSGKITYRGLAIGDGKPALPEAFVKISKETP